MEYPRGPQAWQGAASPVTYARRRRRRMATPIDTPTDGTAPAPASRASGDRLAIAGLLLLVLLLFHSAVMGRGVFYYRDIHLFWHPQIDAFVRSLAAGAWPVWNPYMGFGRPLLGNPNVQ